MAWLEGFEENWTNAVHLTAARLERQLDAGAPPDRDTVRKALEGVNAHWRDPNHFYGVWLRDFRAAHPEAASQFDRILLEMATGVSPDYRAPSPVLPIAGGVVIGAAAFGVLTTVDVSLAVRSTIAVAVAVGAAVLWWKTAQGSRRASRDQTVAQISRELTRYGDRLRKLVAEADKTDTAPGQ